MTSEAPAECYVYITLPGRTEAVTCGRYRLSVDRYGEAAGQFIYGRRYLADPAAVAIDPVELHLRGGKTYRTARLGGVFGALRDAGPDHWGRRVIDRHLGRTTVGELEYLLHAPDDRAGALGFGRGSQPPPPKRSFNATVALERMLTIADAIVQDRPVAVAPDTDQIAALLLIGTSMGGARPKAVVEDSEGLWVAKFNVASDRWNSARVEHGMLMLARRCGITTADSKVVTVGDRDVLLVKRFDRERGDDGYHRARMVSALTLLQADEAPSARARWSYIALAEVLRQVCADPKREVHALFRRMVFNALISNTDDHPRNHAALAWGDRWSLAPAYDLTPSVPISLEHRDLAMVCGDQGRLASAANLMSQCRRFLLDQSEAATIIATLASTVRQSWYATARAAGVSEQECGLLPGAFVYPGFGDPSMTRD
jgi:serine/threonine-protein kinase HipA